MIIINIYEYTKNITDQIKLSVLPTALKCSAFNNLALAKILNHFYNTWLSELCIESMGKHLVSAARDLLKLYIYISTTQLVIFVPYDHGGHLVKKLPFILLS